VIKFACFILITLSRTNLQCGFHCSSPKYCHGDT